MTDRNRVRVRVTDRNRVRVEVGVRIMFGVYTKNIYKTPSRHGIKHREVLCITDKKDTKHEAHLPVIIGYVCINIFDV